MVINHLVLGWSSGVINYSRKRTWLSVKIHHLIVHRRYTVYLHKWLGFPLSCQFYGGVNYLRSTPHPGSQPSPPGWHFLARESQPKPLFATIASWMRNGSEYYPFLWGESKLDVDVHGNFWRICPVFLLWFGLVFRKGVVWGVFNFQVHPYLGAVVPLNTLKTWNLMGIHLPVVPHVAVPEVSKSKVNINQRNFYSTWLFYYLPLLLFDLRSRSYIGSFSTKLP